MYLDSSSFVRSATIPIALPPASFISFTTASTASELMSTTPTDAPSWANLIAPAFPMPDPAAVTNPIFPCIRILQSLLLFGREYSSKCYRSG